MQLSVFLALLSTIYVHAGDATFTDVLSKYASDCKRNTLIDGYLTVAYYYINPSTYNVLDPIHVNSFNPMAALDHLPADEVLMQTACICTEILYNSYDFIVVPVIKPGVADNAFTLCAFHGQHMPLTELLRIPPTSLKHWMLLKFGLKMPRVVEAPMNTATPATCIDIGGFPTTSIYGQTTCYYVNLATFKERSDDYQTDWGMYAGPLLGDQIKSLIYWSHKLGVSSALDFLTMFDFVKCGLIKTKTRLSPSLTQTGCRLRYFDKVTKFAVLFCCCIGQDDPNCRDVTDAIREKKIACLKGTIGSQSETDVGYYFAKQCHHTVIKKYDNVPAKHGGTSAALIVKHQPVMKFDINNQCSSAVTTICENEHVNVIESGCCSGSHFCNLHRGLTGHIKRCKWYFGEDQKKEGCYVVFYRAENQWHLSSPVWFDMGKSEYIHLNSYPIFDTDNDYDVLLGFMIHKKMDSSCDDYTKHNNRVYYIINCEERVCDWMFNAAFFQNFDESVITTAVRNTAIPDCEFGSITFTTSDAALQELPFLPETTRAIGKHCVLRLDTEFHADKTFTISISFGPENPMPHDCAVPAHSRTSNIVCCTAGSTNLTYVDLQCHHTTVLAMLNRKVETPEDSQPEQTPAAVTFRQGIYEKTDFCEQQNLGILGTHSRRCRPGGYGCFHLVPEGKENSEAIASCVGKAEELIAVDDGAHERYREAAICLTEEARDQCLYVQNGVARNLLCCCDIAEERGRVGRCKETTEMMLNANEFPLMKIGDFKDAKDQGRIQGGG